MTLEALVFDLDGTVCDTDDLHFAAFNQLLARFGRAIDQDYFRDNIIGASNEVIMTGLFPGEPLDRLHAYSGEKEAAFRALARTLEPKPGLPALLDWAKARGLGIAAVTNAPRDNAEMMLSGLGIESWFQVLVIGDEVARPKPDPLPYATALDRLGVTASAALAFEDSPTGIRSATGAGIETVALLGAPAETLLREAGASFVIRDFTAPALWDLLRARS